MWLAWKEEPSQLHHHEPQHREGEPDGQRDSKGEQATRRRDGTDEQRAQYLQERVPLDCRQQDEDPSTRQQSCRDSVHRGQPHLAPLEERPHGRPLIGRRLRSCHRVMMASVVLTRVFRSRWRGEQRVSGVEDRLAAVM